MRILRGITWTELIIIVTVATLITAIGIGFYMDASSPHIQLKKADWNCTETKTVTYMQTIITGKTTTVVPITDTVCINYKRK